MFALIIFMLNLRTVFLLCIIQFSTKDHNLFCIYAIDFFYSHVFIFIISALFLMYANPL